MKPDSYKILNRCVEEGVNCGWHFAHKYDDHPKPDYIRDKIMESVMTEICEYFDFNQENNND